MPGYGCRDRLETPCTSTSTILRGGCFLLWHSMVVRAKCRSTWNAAQTHGPEMRSSYFTQWLMDLHRKDRWLPSTFRTGAGRSICCGKRRTIADRRRRTQMDLGEDAGIYNSSSTQFARGFLTHRKHRLVAVCRVAPFLDPVSQLQRVMQRQIPLVKGLASERRLRRGNTRRPETTTCSNRKALKSASG